MTRLAPLVHSGGIETPEAGSVRSASGLASGAIFASAVVAAAMLGGCANSSGTGERSAAAEAAVPAAETKMVSLPFRLDITYSAEALDTLREAGRDLSLTVAYYGPPKTKGARGLDPVLGVRLGSEQLTVEPGPRSVTIKGQVDAALVARDVAGDARVRVMAAGAGIVCEAFDEYLPIAVETGGTVHCELAGE